MAKLTLKNPVNNDLLIITVKRWYPTNKGFTYIDLDGNWHDDNYHILYEVENF